jgi:hypothetical protein
VSQCYPSRVKVEVKVTAVPLYVKQAEGEGSGIALSTIDPDVRKWWVVSAKPRPFYSWKKNTTGDWVSTGPVCKGQEKLAPYRDSIPCIESL